MMSKTQPNCKIVHNLMGLEIEMHACDKRIKIDQEEERM